MNDMTLGMHPGTLTFFVARPGVGKTWVAMMTAMGVWANEDGVKNRGEKRRRVLVVEPEMNRVELAERLVAYHGKIPYGDLISGTLGMFLEKRLRSTADELVEIAEDFFILDDEERLNAEGIEWALDACQAELLVIDSIYMMRVADGKVKKGAGSRGGRYDRMLEVVDWARSLSRRKQIPILGVSQLSREGKVRKSAIDRVKAGRGTGGLEDALAMTDTLLWDVHNLFAVWQDEEMIQDKQLMFIPLKVRRRAKISGLVISWDMQEMTFHEMGTQFVSSRSDDDDDDDDLVF
jgi:replicative DNA helicase